MYKISSAECIEKWLAVFISAERENNIYFPAFFVVFFFVFPDSSKISKSSHRFCWEIFIGNATTGNEWMLRRLFVVLFCYSL